MTGSKNTDIDPTQCYMVTTDGQTATPLGQSDSLKRATQEEMPTALQSSTAKTQTQQRTEQWGMKKVALRYASYFLKKRVMCRQTPSATEGAA